VAVVLLLRTGETRSAAVVVMSACVAFLAGVRPLPDLPPFYAVVMAVAVLAAVVVAARRLTP
jgi:hypothetical protein